MKLKAIIGNPISGNWEDEYFVNLFPYSEIFSKKYPGLPVPDSFSRQLAVEDHELKVYDEFSIFVNAYYEETINSISIFIKMHGKSLVQVMGCAFKDNNSGLSIIFNVPKGDFPIEIRVVP